MLILSPVRKVFHLEKRWWGYVYLSSSSKTLRLWRLFSQHTLCNYFLFSVTLFVANHMFFLRQWRMSVIGALQRCMNRWLDTDSVKFVAGLAFRWVAVMRWNQLHRSQLNCNTSSRHQETNINIDIHRITASRTNISYKHCSVRETLWSYFIIF